ncbi:unnamed protein product, partial [Ixodes persulcatus]
MTVGVGSRTRLPKVLSLIPRMRTRSFLSFVVCGSTRPLRRRRSSSKLVTLSLGPWVRIQTRSSALSRRVARVFTGSDTTESDGIYSAFFTDHTGPGRYQVAVRATGGNSAKTVTPPADHSSFSELGRLPLNLSVPFKRAYQMSELAVDSRRFRASAARVRSEPCGAFERHALVGAFQLTGYGERTGTAPGVVQDLQVQDSFFRGSRWMVQLSWTEMGAYGDASTVGTVDVRCSQYANQLEESFEEAIKIQKADLLRGSLSPQAPNKKHELLIQVPLSTNARALSSTGRPSFNLFFAVKTRNDEGDESPVSNIARLSYGGHLNLRSRPRLVKVQ